jgi:Na+-transporting methylmalonyl-CoA/oxaloacetate decarboxylase gamma subunit
MFIDTVVVAGVGTVLLMLAFLAGFGYVIWKDSKKPKKG